MTTMTVDQRKEALGKANKIRTRRSQLKRDVTAGRVQAVDIITEPPEWAGTMRVANLLEAIFGVGESRTRHWLERAGVPVTGTLGQLSARQRRDLAANVGRREPKTTLRAHGGPWQPAMLHANAIRFERGTLHAAVITLPHGERRERIASLLEDPPRCIASMLVADLLLWADRVGPFQARRLMGAARVSTGRRVDLTTERQRTALAACLRGDVAEVREEAERREWAARAAA